MARPMRSPQSDYSRVVALCLLIWQAVLSDRHDRHLVLHFAHGDGQAHTRSTTDDVGHDDGLAGGRKLREDHDLYHGLLVRTFRWLLFPRLDTEIVDKCL